MSSHVQYPYPQQHPLPYQQQYTQQHPQQQQYQLQQQQYNQQNQYQSQNQKIQELTYCAYQDMMNVLSVSTQIDEFENYINTHPGIAKQAQELMLIQRNRLILMINLSNTIHADLKHTAQGDGLQNQLQQVKQDCRQIVSQYQNSFQNQFIKESLGYYINNNVSSENYMKEKKMYDIKRKAEFNDKVIQKVFSAMNQQDNIMGKIRKNGFTIPTKDQIQYSLDQARYDTANKINQIDFSTLEDEDRRSSYFCECNLI